MYDEYLKQRTNFFCGFTPRILEEVEYNGKRYVRMKVFRWSDSRIRRDKQEELIQEWATYFVEVEKVTFLRLKDNDGKEYALAETCLFAGVQFDLYKDSEKHNYKSSVIDLSKHNLGRHLHNYFAKDIEQGLNTDIYTDNVEKMQEKNSSLTPEAKENLRNAIKFE